MQQNAPVNPFRTSVRTEADSTAGAVFGFVVGLCAAVAVIMLTVKLGFVLFT